MQCGFHKKESTKKNQLISIKFTTWDKLDKFPKGELIDIFGDYNNLSSMENALIYLYQLDFKKMKLNNSIHININDRVEISDKIYSIDPEGCKDIDDAFSLIQKEDTTIFKIHISDVYSVLYQNNIIEYVCGYSSIYQSNQTIRSLQRKNHAR